MIQIKKIIFDVTKDYLPSNTIKAKRGDTCRTILFTFTQDGVPINLNGKYVRCYGLKEDKKVIFADLTIVNAIEGQALLQLTQQMLALAGVLKMEIIIFSGEFDLYSTTIFQIEVDNSIRNTDYIVSTDEFDSLTKALKKLDNWNELMESKYFSIEETYMKKLNAMNAAIESGLSSKMDADATIGMGNLSQEVKEAMTGGGVAVVGENAVNTINVCDGAITFNKLGVELGNQLGEFKELTFTTQNGYYNAFTGDFVESSSYKSIKIRCSQGDRIKIITTISGSSCAEIVKYDSSGNYAGYVNKGVDGSRVSYNNTIIIDDSVGYIAINNVSGTEFSIYMLDLIPSSELKESINTSIEILSNYIDLDIVTTDGLYISTTGVLDTSFTSFKSSNKVACKKGDKFHITTSISGSASAIVYCYDTDNAFIKCIKKGIDGIRESYEDYLITADFDGFIGVSSLSDYDLKIKKFKLENIDAEHLKVPSEYSSINAAIQNGKYVYNTGEFESTTTWQSCKINCTPGEVLKVTSAVKGSTTALAVYFSENGTYLGHINRGTDSNGETTEYKDYAITIPSGACYVAFSFATGYNFKVKRLKKVFYSNVVSTLKKVESKVENMNVSSSLSYWKGKEIVWFGTSIPETGYPDIVGELLGATVYNEAKGSSMARIGTIDKTTDPNGWTGVAWQNVAYSLAMSAAEKQDLIDNWSTYKSLFMPESNPPNTLTDEEKEKILNCSYEHKLNKYLTSNYNIDLWIFDHGHNDNFRSSCADLDTIPDDAYDRNYFIGAMNFLINKILEYNPHAKIVFIGHYEKARKTQIYRAQEVLAEYWNFPICKLWDKLGWSQRKVKTTGYWSDNYTWVESGGEERNLTMTKLWLADDLHPYNSKAKKLIANNIATWLENSVR